MRGCVVSASGKGRVPPGLPPAGAQKEKLEGSLKNRPWVGEAWHTSSVFCLHIMVDPLGTKAKRFFHLSLMVSGLLGAGVMQAFPAQAVTIWQWSFSTDLADQFGEGTFTTADVTPNPGVTYALIGITGTYHRDGTSHTITALSSAFQANNVFRWDGTSLSAILSDNRGISFTAGSTPVNISHFPSGFDAINGLQSDFNGRDGNITSSQLNPVPGPLPLLGAAAAYRWSRSLRRRRTKIG